jgi:hypothetical protein
MIQDLNLKKNKYIGHFSVELTLRSHHMGWDDDGQTVRWSTQRGKALGCGGERAMQSSVIQHWSGRSKAKRPIEISPTGYCGQVFNCRRSTNKEPSEEPWSNSGGNLPLIQFPAITLIYDNKKT